MHSFILIQIEPEWPLEVYKINKLVSKPHVTVLTTDFVKPLILLVLSRCYKNNHQSH